MAGNVGLVMIGRWSSVGRSAREEINMRAKYCYLPVILLLFFYVVLFSANAEADLYIYKDKSGHMVITDLPPENVEIMEMIKDKGRISSRSSGFRDIKDIEMDLTKKYQRNSDIEKASLSPAYRGVKADVPARKEQPVVLRQTAAAPPVITKANSSAFKYSEEVIQVPADIERR